MSPIQPVRLADNFPSLTKYVPRSLAEMKNGVDLRTAATRDLPRRLDLGEVFKFRKRTNLCDGSYSGYSCMTSMTP